MRFLRFLTVFLFTSFFALGAPLVFAYDDETTHPALTDEIVDFYNLLNPGAPLSPEEKEWIVEGSILEDTPPRWINHFYDPVRKTGWTGEHTGWVPEETIRAFSRIGLSAQDPLSAVEWVNAYYAQQAYAPYGGNRSWKRGLEYFTEGNREEAFRTLGYVLHLLEDLSVPDHTRNDTHAHAVGGFTGDEGSPYENYAKRWTRESIASLKIPELLKQSGAVPPKYRKVEEYLFSLAEYSNKHFFSKDTINSSYYDLPRVIYEKDLIGYGADAEGEFPLVAIDLVLIPGDFEYRKEYSLASSDTSILDAYFQRLSKKVVLLGPGIIELFLRDADTARVNSEYPTRLVQLDFSWATLPNFSAIGILSQMKESVRSMTYAISQSVQDAWSRFGVQNVPEQSANIAGVFSGAPLALTIPPIVLPPFPSASSTTSSQSASSSPGLIASLPSASSEPRTVLARGEDESGFEPSSSSTPSSGSVTPLASEIVLPETSSSPLPPSSIPPFSGSGSVTFLGVSEMAPSSNSAPIESVASEQEELATSSLLTSSVSPLQIQHFQSRYETSSLQLHFDWVVGNMENFSSTLLSRLSIDSSTVHETTSSMQFSHRISEVGREYMVTLSVSDEAGRIAETSTRISVPSFLSGISFTRDPLGTSYMLRVRYSEHPFIPQIYSEPTYGRAWQGMVFYLNRDAQVLNGSISSASYHAPADLNGVLRLRTSPPRDGAIFGIAPERSSGIGGGLNNSSFYLPDEDLLFDMPLVVSPSEITFTSSDYVTVGYYDLAHTGGGSQDLSLVAVDKTRFYFSETLLDQPPSVPRITEVPFWPEYPALAVRWDPSRDPDGADSRISYEIQYSTSTSLASHLWENIGTVPGLGFRPAYPDSYIIGIRARDEFGSVSDPAVHYWSFPADYLPAL